MRTHDTNDIVEKPVHGGQISSTADLKSVFTPDGWAWETNRCRCEFCRKLKAVVRGQGQRRGSGITKKSSKSEMIRRLEMEIRLNEMVPADRRCDDHIARLKAKLAALQRPPATVLQFEPRQ